MSPKIPNFRNFSTNRRSPGAATAVKAAAREKNPTDLKEPTIKTPNSGHSELIVGEERHGRTVVHVHQ